MPDVYAAITEADEAIQERLADVLELRAADEQQRSMLESYLTDLAFPRDAEVLEVGCGSGAVSRALARWPGVSRVIGLDPSAVLLDRARQLNDAEADLSFVEGDARALPLADASFDLIVFHTTLCHIPGPDGALAEAYRVCRPGGQLAVFDGDYATTTVATGEHDPLQSCADAAMAALVHDRWLIRRLPELVATAGFRVGGLRSHGFTESDAPQYMLTIVDRGADALVADRLIAPDAAQALKDEARNRVRNGTFFGHIAYASLIADRPGATEQHER